MTAEHRFLAKFGALFACHPRHNPRANMGRPYRKKTAREHQAAVELASKRRRLAKLLKQEGFDGVPLDRKPKEPEPAEEEAPVDAAKPEQKSKEESERERQSKLAERKKRAQALMKRTKKGQPFMKNIVGDLVQKLERSKEQ